MRLWWTSRALLDAEHDARLRAEAQVILLETQFASTREKSEQANRILQSQADSYREENKLLLDRILTSVGQAPIFHPVPSSAPPAAVAPSTSNIEAPATRVSLDDVHREARKAIKAGTFSMTGAKG